MADYIERAAAVTACDKQYRECLRKSDFCGDTVAWNICADIKAIPAADVAPVVHGRWECAYDDSTGETDITCSHCKNTRTVNGCFVSTDGKSCYFEDDYCPNCGAKMDGGADYEAD